MSCRGGLREAAGEGDFGMVLDAEEIRAAQALVAGGLARPDPGGVDLTWRDLTLERRPSSALSPHGALQRHQTTAGSVLCQPLCPDEDVPRLDPPGASLTGGWR